MCVEVCAFSAVFVCFVFSYGAFSSVLCLHCVCVGIVCLVLCFELYFLYREFSMFLFVLCVFSVVRLVLCLFVVCCLVLCF